MIRGKYKLSVIFSLLKSYFSSKSEWYFGYRAAIVVLLTTLSTYALYGTLGNSLLFTISLLLLKIGIAVHVLISLISLLNDYVYNVWVKEFSKVLITIIVFKVFIILL